MVPLIYIMLIAGGGANKSGYLNGAFVFDLNCDLSYGIFVNGSAKKDRKLTKASTVFLVNLSIYYIYGCIKIKDVKYTLKYS